MVRMVFQYFVLHSIDIRKAFFWFCFEEVECVMRTVCNP